MCNKFIVWLVINLSFLKESLKIKKEVSCEVLWITQPFPLNFSLLTKLKTKVSEYRRKYIYINMKKLL